MTQRIVSIDVDLRKTFAVVWDEVKGARTLVNNKPHGPLLDALHSAKPDLVLVEVASAVDYTSMPGVAHNKRRWMIYNIAVATMIYEQGLEGGWSMLVAPSSAWTRGFELTVRHKMSGTQQSNKDLREADSMRWFYQRHPKAWRTLPEYLAAI